MPLSPSEARGKMPLGAPFCAGECRWRCEERCTRLRYASKVYQKTADNIKLAAVKMPPTIARPQFLGE